MLNVNIETNEVTIEYSADSINSHHLYGIFNPSISCVVESSRRTYLGCLMLATLSHKIDHKTGITMCSH